MKIVLWNELLNEFSVFNMKIDMFNEKFCELFKLLVWIGRIFLCGIGMSGYG